MTQAGPRCTHALPSHDVLSASLSIPAYLFQPLSPRLFSCSRESMAYVMIRDQQVTVKHTFLHDVLEAGTVTCRLARAHSAPSLLGASPRDARPCRGPKHQFKVTRIDCCCNCIHCRSF